MAECGKIQISCEDMVSVIDPLPLAMLSHWLRAAQKCPWSMVNLMTQQLVAISQLCNPQQVPLKGYLRGAPL